MKDDVVMLEKEDYFIMWSSKGGIYRVTKEVADAVLPAVRSPSEEEGEAGIRLPWLRRVRYWSNLGSTLHRPFLLRVLAPAPEREGTSPVRRVYESTKARRMMKACILCPSCERTIGERFPMGEGESVRVKCVCGEEFCIQDQVDSILELVHSQLIVEARSC